MASVHAVIMITDIKGFTERVNKGDRKELNHLVTLHGKLLPPVFQFFDGKIIKTIGDAFLVTFSSPTNAVKCGMAIQEILRLHNQRAPENDQLSVRVAINAGEVEESSNDILGEAVNITARLEGHSQAGEVYFTEAVYLSMNRNEAPSMEVGPMHFKGIAEPIQVYKAIREPDSDFLKWLLESVTLTEKGPIFKGAQPKSAKMNLWVAGLVLSIIAIGVITWTLTLPSLDEIQVTINKEYNQNNYRAAVEHAGKGLKRFPESRELKAWLMRSGREHLFTLYRTSGSDIAATWLSETTAKEGFGTLSTLKSEFESHRVCDGIKEGGLDDKSIQESLNELLGAFPEDPLVAGTCADILAGEVFYGYPLWLYGESLERGARADDSIFKFMEKLFAIDSPGNLKQAHKISDSHFAERYHEWAKEVLKQNVSGNPSLVANAWHALKQNQDPLIEEPYFQHYSNLADGYWQGGIDAAKDAIRVFLEQDDPIRQEQLKAMTFTKTTTSKSGYGDALELTRDKLATAWSWSAPVE